ncbi:MAG: Dps family protein [Caulobacter sp.]|nr:Dps family protein [Caulobacter sp.]
MATKIDTGIAAKDRAAVAQSLSKVLADTYAVYQKTHGYHWNVRGPNFSSLHALFMDQYTEQWQALDVIAERIRALGQFAPQSAAAFGNLTAVKDGDPEKDWEGMVSELKSDHETVVATLRDLIEVGEAAGDDVSVDLATQRLTVHEKHAWMLRATLGEK